MLLCFVCLIEDRADPAKAITHVQGTSVCRDHLTALRQVTAQVNTNGQAAEPEVEIDVEKMRRQITFLKTLLPLLSDNKAQE